MNKIAAIRNIKLINTNEMSVAINESSIYFSSGNIMIPYGDMFIGGASLNSSSNWTTNLSLQWKKIRRYKSLFVGVAFCFKNKTISHEFIQQIIYLSFPVTTIKFNLKKRF